MHKPSDPVLAQQEEAALLRLRRAIEDKDLFAIEAFTQEGCGLSFKMYPPDCQLTEVCGDPEGRSVGIVKALLAGGHPVEGLVAVYEGVSPISELLKTPGPGDSDIFDVLLTAGASVGRIVPYDAQYPDIDETIPLWVQVLRTGRVDLVKVMLTHGWDPEEWRSWPQNPQGPAHPLEALENLAALGPFHHRTPWMSETLLLPAALELLDLLVRRGFDVAASDVHATAEWSQAWVGRQHARRTLEEGLSCPVVSRQMPRL